MVLLKRNSMFVRGRDMSLVHLKWCLHACEATVINNFSQSRTISQLLNYLRPLKTTAEIINAKPKDYLFALVGRSFDVVCV